MEASGAGQPTFGNFIKALFFNASFETIYWYRIYARLFPKTAGCKILARLIQRRVRKNCSCDISPECQIGDRTRFMHPQGVVIGAGVVIGNDVKIYQNVTLGRKDETPGYPTIKDNATIYAGACVLGDITIGENAVIGANAVVSKDVPNNTTVVGAPAKALTKKAAPKKKKAA